MRPVHVLSVCIFCLLLLPACTREREKEKVSAGDKRYTGADLRVIFSEESGVPGKRTISLSAPEGCRIHYTTDGSVPTSESPVCQGTVTLSRKGNRWVGPETAGRMAVQSGGKLFHPVRASSRLPGANVIRAVVVAPGGTTGEVATRTYFVGADLKRDYGGAMVVSIVTDPDNLLDYADGILAAGKIFDDWAASPAAEPLDETNEWKAEANFTQRGKAWERPASIELFDNSNTLTTRQECGIRLKGRMSRMYAQKSWNISFKKPYGGGSLDYPLFPDAVDAATGEVIARYRSFSLRNGGNEAERLKFKDSWIQSRVPDRDFSTQKSRIAVLFLNGEYWGHYNLIEKYDEGYIRNHYGVETPLIINEHRLDEGRDSDFRLYEELVSFQDRDLSRESDWEAFKQVMDVRSMADYFATEIYIGNYDWRDTTNTMLWRSAAVQPSNPYSDGRWRYLLCDTEFSSGLYSSPGMQPEYDTFTQACAEHPLFAAAMRNPEFRDLFTAAMDEIARNNFDPRDVEADLKAWAKRWKRFMPYYYERFGNTSWAWRPSIKATTDFFHRRSAALRKQGLL